MRNLGRIENPGFSLEPLKLLIEERNLVEERFNLNLTRRADYSTGELTPEEYTLSLEPLDLREDIHLEEGPYPLFGDYLQVGDSRVRMPVPSAATRSTIPFYPISLLGNLVISILSPEGYSELSIQIGPSVESIIDQATQIPLISSSELVDLINIEGYGKVEAEESNGLITITGEDNAYCVMASGSVGKLLGFPSKLTSLHSGHFVDSSHMARLLGGSSFSEEIYTGDISTANRLVVDPIIAGRSKVQTPYGSYILQNGELTPYKTLTPVNNLPTRMRASITKDKVRVPSMLGEVTSSHILGAFKQGVFNKFTPDTSAIEGDISSEGYTIKASTSKYVEIHPRAPAGEHTFRCPRYSASVALSKALSHISARLLDPTTYEECLLLNAELSRLLAEVTAQELAINSYSNDGGTEEKRALAKIRAAHLDLGYDRAWELLSNGHISEYLDLSDQNASFTGHIHSLVDKVAPSVRAL